MESRAGGDNGFPRFVYLHPGVSRSVAYTPSPFAGGYNEATRFDVCNPGCVERTIGADSTANQVNFDAPAGSSLTAGESYFVNVITNGPSDRSNTSFSAFLTSEVSEPAAMALRGTGLIGIAATRRRR